MLNMYTVINTVAIYSLCLFGTANTASWSQSPLIEKNAKPVLENGHETGCWLTAFHDDGTLKPFRPDQFQIKTERILKMTLDALRI